MNIAYKFRAYPTKAQQILLAKTFGCVRFIYNQMLADKIEYYKQTGKPLNPTPAQYKERFPWLKEVDSMALCNAQMHLKHAYENFFKNGGFPKFKSKKNPRRSYTTNRINNNIRLENNGLKLPKIGVLKIKQHRQIPAGYRLKSVTVTQVPSGKYYVSILFEYDATIPNITPKTYVGLDFSMHDLCISSDGKSANYPRYYRLAEEKLKHEQRKLSHMKLGSKNYKKQRLKVNRLYERVRNQRRDFLHKHSRQITNAYDCVCIEDLNMKNMSQALHFGKSVHDDSWGMFTNFLEYKLKQGGKYLVKVDKFFPSSQLCSCCEYKNPNVKDLSMRSWTCPNCGTHHNRDINAAINIRNEGIRILSQ